MSMVKKWVSFTSPQFDWLEQTAEELGISVGEYVRRIIDDYRLSNGNGLMETQHRDHSSVN